mmetsp:Transcript_95340/g.294034  ORF Transcript_95340/g.294034 Transcript_95340/m.294034 type:complete len:216 (-) Transcript_95340:87-734(-)
MLRLVAGRLPRRACLATAFSAAPPRAGVLPGPGLRTPLLRGPWRCFSDAGALLRVKTPDFGAESITEGTLMDWQKQVGDFCAKGEILAVIETDKVSVEVKAEENGTLEELLAKADDTVEVGQELAVLRLGGAPAPKAAAAPVTPKAAAPPAAPAAECAAPAAPPAASAAAPSPPPAAAATAPKPAPTPARPAAPRGGKRAAVPFWEVSYRKHWYG